MNLQWTLLLTPLVTFSPTKDIWQGKVCRVASLGLAKFFYYCWKETPKNPLWTVGSCLGCNPSLGQSDVVFVQPGFDGCHCAWLQEVLMWGSYHQRLLKQLKEAGGQVLCHCIVPGETS